MSGRLEAGTTTGGNSAPSDGSQGKLNIEKNRETKRTSLHEQKQFASVLRGAVSKR
jgi:hypothetical protein